MKLYMLRTIPLSIIRSLFTVHSAMVYVIQLSSRSIRFCSKAVYDLVWYIPLLSVQWINSWWWTDELSETCRVSCQNKFVKLVHLVGFITKKKGVVVTSDLHPLYSAYVVPELTLMLATVWGNVHWTAAIKCQTTVYIYFFHPRSSYPSNSIVDIRGHAPLFQCPMTPNIMTFDGAHRWRPKSGS